MQQEQRPKLEPPLKGGSALEEATDTIEFKFENGDIVIDSRAPKQWFRLSEVSQDGLWAGFDPITRAGRRDRRWDVGYSGSTRGYKLVKRPGQETKLKQGVDN